jgi:hypothetical protein
VLHTDTVKATASSGTTDIDCIDCHTATAGTGAGMPIDPSTPAGDKVHDACTTCHDADGTLTGSANGNDGGTAGGTDGGGFCVTCHGSNYFASHTHGEAGNHGVNFDDTVDESQSGGAAGECNECHQDQTSTTASIRTWIGIAAEHDLSANTTIASPKVACVTCHDYVNNGNQSGLADTPLLATVQSVIAAGGTPTCIECHRQKSFADSPSTSAHGGHSASAFAWTGTTESTCGTADCHDSATNTNVTSQVHNGRFAAEQGSPCENCHDNNQGGAGTAILGPTDGDSDARNATGPQDLTAACTVCHNTKTIPAMHHTTPVLAIPSQYAQDGECVTCHLPKIEIAAGPSYPPVATRGSISMPANLPCNLCHLYFAGFAADPQNNTGYVTSGGKVQIYRNRFNPNSTEWGTLPTVTPLANHLISENTTTPISDYGACFACHGASGAGTLADNSDSAGLPDKIGPFHGLGTPYTNTADPGDGTGTGGTLDDVTNAYAGPQKADMGGVPDDDPITNPAKQVPFHPGWMSLNWLACEVGYNCGTTKPYGNDSSPGWHQNDLGLRNPATYNDCVSGNFTVPWDDYANAGGSTTMSKNFGWIGTNASLSTNVPLVPLSLTSGNCAIRSTVTFYGGTGASGKQGDVMADGNAYVDIVNPYPASESNNGTVTLVTFDTVDTDGTITIFTCTPNGPGTTCDITDSVDTAVANGVPEPVSLLIEPGGVVGIWHSGGGVIDTAKPGGSLRMEAGVAKPVDGGGMDPLDISGSAPNHDGNYIYNIEVIPY